MSEFYDMQRASFLRAEQDYLREPESECPAGYKDPDCYGCKHLDGLDTCDYPRCHNYEEE